MVMDETLYSVQAKVQNFAVMYLVDITKVPDFNKVRSSEMPARQSSLMLLRRCTSSMIPAHSCSSTGTSTS